MGVDSILALCTVVEEIKRANNTKQAKINNKQDALREN